MIAVDELSVPDAVLLVHEALGKSARPGLAEWLGRIAPDCPLIIVVAAALISRGSVDPARLHASNRVRVEIMQAFRDAMTAGVDTGDPDVRREVLNAVAAFQPVRIDDAQFQAAMSAVAQRPFDQVVPYLNALEDAQVLQRRGTSLRVVPDLLGMPSWRGHASIPRAGPPLATWIVPTELLRVRRCCICSSMAAVSTGRCVPVGQDRVPW